MSELLLIFGAFFAVFVGLPAFLFWLSENFDYRK